MSLEIVAVRKDRDGDITHLKGSSGWTDTIDGVIADIEGNKFSYYVRVGGQGADVYVVPATLFRKKHLKTTADTTTRNNLDELDSF